MPTDWIDAGLAPHQFPPPDVERMLEDMVGHIPDAVRTCWMAYGLDHYEWARVDPSFEPEARRRLIEGCEEHARTFGFTGRIRIGAGAVGRAIGAIGGALAGAVGLGTVVSASQALAGAPVTVPAAPPTEPTRSPVMPNGLALTQPTNGSFPWTTLIQQVGAVAGQVIPALVNGSRRVNGTIGGATALDPSAVMPVAAMGLMPALTAGVGMAVRGAARLAPILARMAVHVGRRVPVKSAVALARRVGPTAAAVALGITADEMMQLITSEVTRPRRRRGISARDIAKARSTIRRMTSFMAMLPRRHHHHHNSIRRRRR